MQGSGVGALAVQDEDGFAVINIRLAQIQKETKALEFQWEAAAEALEA